MLCFTQLGYRDVAVMGWDKVERQGSTRLSNAVINLLLFLQRKMLPRSCPKRKLPRESIHVHVCPTTQHAP